MLGFQGAVPEARDREATRQVPDGLDGSAAERVDPPSATPAARARLAFEPAAR